MNTTSFNTFGLKPAREPDMIGLERTIHEQRDYMLTNETMNKERIFSAYSRNKELVMKCEGLEKHVHDLRNEVNHWKLKYEDAMRQLKMARSDQMKLTGANFNNMGEIHKVMAVNSSLSNQKELADIKNEDLMNQLKKISIHNDSLKHRLDNFEDSSKLSTANLTSMLSQKSKDLNDMKWKLNDALELKRRVEMDSESMKFELENLRSRYVADMKEKDLRLAQQQRNFDDTIDLKTQEWKNMMDKYVRLENDYNIIYEKHKNTSSQNETYRLKLEHLNQMRKMGVSGGFGSERSLEFPGGGGDYPLMKNPMYNRDPMFQNSAAQGFASDLKSYRSQNDMKYSIRHKTDLYLKVAATIEMVEERYKAIIKGLMYNIWKLRFKLRSATRMEAEMYQIKTGSLAPATSLNNAKTVGEGLLIILTFMRSKICDMLFEVFMRSVTGAHKKKANSLILFIINVREFKSAQRETLSVLSQVYMKVRQLAKKFIPNFSNVFMRFANQINNPRRAARASSKINLKNIARLDEEPNADVFRDNINKWIEDTLTVCVNKYNDQPKAKNRDFLFLYRLLTIAYRIRYPLRGKSYNPDIDLKVYLEHQICAALERVLNTDPVMLMANEENEY